MANCKDCKFWKKYSEGSSEGNCHRYPPNVVMLETFHPAEQNPKTYASDWCGEYKMTTEKEFTTKLEEIENLNNVSRDTQCE